MTCDVFISYSRRDTELADRVAESLEARGVRCFIDRDSIELSDDFAEKISKAIYECEVLLFIWTESSNQSENTANEVALAKMYGKKIIPFMVGDFIPHYKLAYHLVRNNRADRGQGFTTDKLDGLAEEVMRTVETARRERMHDEQRAVAEEQSRAEAESMVRRMDERRIERAEKTHAAARDADPADARYESDYRLGCDRFRRYKLDEAFGFLIEPALAGYKDAQTFIYYCVCTPPRCCRIRRERFERLRPQAEAGDGFALFLLSVFAEFQLNDTAAAFDFAERSANAGSEFGKLRYIVCLEFGIGTDVDTEKAIAQLRRLAVAGNPLAQQSMGRHLIYGWVCDAYPELGFRMLNEAADAGEICSLDTIGSLYRCGDKCVEKDEAKAAGYYERAAAAGWVESYNNLGHMYGYDDTGNPKEIRRGFDFYMKGAELSEPGCMESIGLIYESGQNGRPNIAAAVKWYKRAAEAGSKFAYCLLGHIYYYGRDGIPADNRTAWNYFEQGAARFRSWECYYMLGCMYMDGCAPNSKTAADAVEYFEKTVFGGSSCAGDAACRLYDMFHEGVAVERDERRAIGYLEKAAGYDDTGALLKLGRVLTSDLDSLYSDEIKGMRCLQRACDKGSNEAAIALAELYRQGIATIRDTDKAKELLQLAIDRGNSAQAMCEMGKLFSCAAQADWDETRDDVSDEQREADNDIAMEYFRHAAEQQYPEAYSRMAEIAIDRAFSDNTPEDAAEKWKDDFAEWSRKGAEAGYPQSLLDMGVAFDMGVGVGKDIGKAEEWYRKAVDAGVKAAPASLASLYIEELPDRMDDVCRLLALARRRGHDTASQTERFEKRCRELAADMEKEEVFDAERFARQALPLRIECSLEEVGDLIANGGISTYELYKAYAEAVDAMRWLPNAPKLSELVEKDFENFGFISPLRLDTARIWGYLRRRIPPLGEISFFDQEAILDIVEPISDSDLQLAAISIVNIYFELVELYGAISRAQRDRQSSQPAPATPASSTASAT